MAEFPFACGECPKVFKTAVGLGSHQKAHKPKMKCEHCGEEVSSLDAHKRREHMTEIVGSDVERNLRADNERLRQLVGRKDAEITRLRGKLALAIRGGGRV